MQESTRPIASTVRKRPISVSILAVLLELLGAVFSIAGVLAFAIHVSTQVIFNPFRHNISFFFTRWDLLFLLVLLGAWFLWTGFGLWKIRRIAFYSAWVILALFLVRGLLALLPPIERDFVTFAVLLILPAGLGMIVLWRSSACFPIDYRASKVAEQSAAR